MHHVIVVAHLMAIVFIQMVIAIVLYAILTLDGQEITTHIHTNSIVQIKGSAERLQKRKISQSTCERFKVYRDGDKLRFYYHDPSGIVKGAKIKTKDKQFTYEGETPGTFFGQHLWGSSGKRIIITEGELDCVSYGEIFPNLACSITT